MHNSSTAGRKGPDTDPLSYGVESHDPETPQYEWLGGYHRTRDQCQLIRGDRLSLVMAVTEAAASRKRVRPAYLEG